MHRYLLLGGVAPDLVNLLTILPQGTSGNSTINIQPGGRVLLELDQTPVAIALDPGELSHVQPQTSFLRSLWHSGRG